jgi:hypothetical protein
MHTRVFKEDDRRGERSYLSLVYKVSTGKPSRDAQELLHFERSSLDLCLHRIEDYWTLQIRANDRTSSRDISCKAASVISCVLVVDNHPNRVI